MNRCVLVVVTTVFVLMCNTSKAQFPIAYYDFEINAARNTTIETVLQESISGVGSPTITATSLTSSDGIGNGATYTGTNTGYALGYYGFTSNASSASTDPNIKFGPFVCTGFSTMTISMDVFGVGTQAPDNVDIYYSLNDVTYTRINVTTVVSNGSWNTRTFTVPNAANGAATLYFKVIGFNGGATPTAGDGEMKIDNFTLRSALITTSKTLISRTAHGTGLSSGGSFLPTYASLNVNGAAINVTASSDIVFTGVLTLTSGNFVMNSDTLAFQTTTSPIARNGGSQTGNIVMGASSKLAFGRPGSVGGNNFTIPANTFSTSPLSITSLTIQKTNAITLNNQAITLSGNLNLTAGTLNNAGNSITVAGNITGTGTEAGTGVVTMTGTGATISGATISNLELNNAGGFSLSASPIITGTLALTNGTLAIGSNTLTFRIGDVPISRTAGTISTSSSSNIAFGTTGTGNQAGNAFTIPNDAFTSSPVSINSLTVNRTNSLTLGNQTFNLAGNLVLTAGTLDDNGTTITVAGNITGTGTHSSTGAGTILMTTSAATISGATLGNIELNNAGGFSLSGSATIAGTLTLTNGALAVGTNTLTFRTANIPISKAVGGNITVATTSSLAFGTAGNTGGNSFTLPNDLFTSAPTITNLTVNRTNPIIVGNQNFTVIGILTLSAGEFDVLSTTLTFRTGGTPIIKTGGTLTIGSGANLIFGTTGNLGGAAFAIPNGTFTAVTPSFTSLTVQRTNALTLGDQDITLSGNLNLTAGTLNDNGRTITVGTNITGTGTEAGAGVVLMTGSGGTISGATLSNLQLNNAGGFSLAASPTIAGTLTLTNGALSIGGNTLTFRTADVPIARASGTITTTSSSNFIFGTTGNTGGNSFTLPNDVFTTGPTIAALTINRTNPIALGNQGITLVGILTLTAGELNVASNTLTFQTHNTPILKGVGTGTITTTISSNLVFGTTGNLGGTAFAIPNDVFTNPLLIGSFSVQRTNALTLGNQDITLSGSLNLTAGTLNDNGRTITVGANITGTGTEAGAGLILMTGSGGTISGATLTNLQLNNAGGFSLSGSPTIAGTLTLTTGALAVGANTLTFITADVPLARTSGTITTTSSSNLIFGTALNLAGNAFAIPNNTFTSAPASINSFTIQRTNPLTLGNQNISLAGNLNLTAGTLNDNGTTITVAGNITGTGTEAGTGLVLMTGSGGTISGATLSNLQLNNAGGFSLSGSPTIVGTLTLTDGALAIGANTLTFITANVPLARTSGTITTTSSSNFIFGTAGNIGGNAFAIPNDIFTAPPSFNNFTVNRTNALTIGNQDFTINGILTLTLGVLDVLNTTLTFQTGATPIVKTGGTLTVGATSSLVFGTPGNIGGAAFTIPPSTFTTAPSINNLTVNRTNALTWNTQALTIDGTLNLTLGAFSLGAMTLGFQNGATPIIRTTGTLTVTTSTNISFGTNIALFTIPDGTFTTAPVSINDLTINRAGGVTSGNQAFTINNTLTLTDGAFNILNNAIIFTTGATPIAKTGGTLTVGAATNISFVANAAAFTIPNNTFTTAATFNALTINRVGGVIIGNQNFTLNGTFTLTAGVFDILNTTLTLQGTGSIIARNGGAQIGTITVGSTASLYFGGTGNNTIPASAFTTAPSLSNLTVNRGNTLTWNNQSITLDGTLALDAGVLSIGAITLSFQNGAIPITRTTGTLTVATTSNITFGTQAGLFTIPNSMFTASPPLLGDLTINRAGGVTAGNQGFTINGTLALTDGIFDILNNAITLSGTTAISKASGTLTVGASTNITFGANAAAFTIPNNTFTSAPTITGLNINRVGGVTIGNQAFTLNGVLTLTAGIFDALNTTLTLQGTGSTIARNGGTQTGTLTLGTSANLYFGGTGANTIPASAFTTAPSINNLTVNRTNTLTWNNQALTINGILALDAGVLSLGNNTLTLQNGNTPLTRTTGTLTVGATANLVFGTPGNTGGTAFTIPTSFFTATPPSFASFTINRTNSLTLNATQGLTLAGDLNLTAGTLDNAGRPIIISTGNITGTGTELGAGQVTMTGSAATISGATISNLTLNNAGGFSLTGSPSITNALALTNGALAVGANTLTFHTGNAPITRTTGTITLASTSSLAFGTVGNLGGNAFTIPANTFTAAPEFANFVINRTNSLTLNAQDFTLTGLFSLTAGQLILPSNYTFTLRSTSITNTALVDKVGATGIITYNTGAAFKVERFIPQTGFGIRAYRDVSPSVNTGTRKIFDTWQESGTNGLVSGVYYGTHVTGKVGSSPGGVDATTGFDLTGSGAASLYSSNISIITGADSFDPVPSTNQTNDTLSALKGYRLLIRGNRLVNLYQSPTPTTMNAPAILRSTGTLITGTVTFTTTGTSANGGTNTGIRLNSASDAGFTMIGNPYASPVVWDSLAANATSIQSTYWMFDPNIGATGSYVTYNTLTGSSNLASNANKYIQPGQGFFIKNSALAPAPVLIFREDYKAPNIANLTGVYRTSSADLSKINISLKKPVTNRGVITVDAAAVAYDNSFSNGIGQEDGTKITNGGENIAINSKGITLSVEGRKNPTINDTLQLRLWQVTTGVSYQLAINTTEFVDNGLQAYLLDRFTNSQTTLTMNGIKEYPFVTTADTNSYNHRFKIVFKTNGTLPINFTSIKASAYNKGVNVAWSAAEANVNNYQIQRSTDAVHFTTIGTTNAKGNGSSSLQQYLWFDAIPFANYNYYRIMSTDFSGNIKYSSIVLVNITGIKESITVYPNPVKGKIINLQLNNMETGDYNIALYNLNGQIVFSSKINVGSNAMSQGIPLPQAFAAGTYMLSLTKDEFAYKQKIIVQ